MIEASYFRLTLSVISLEEIDCQVRSTEGDDETVFKRERHVESDKCAGAFSEVSDVVLSVSHIVLDYQMAVTNAIIFVLLDHEVVVDIAFC